MSKCFLPVLMPLFLLGVVNTTSAQSPSEAFENAFSLFRTDPITALSAFDELIEASQRTGEQYYRGRAFMHKASFVSRRGEPVLAMSFFDSALVHLSKFEHDQDYARAHLFIGEHFYRLGDIPSALSWLERARRMAEAGQYIMLQADVRLSLANLSYVEGDFANASEEYVALIKLYEQLGDQARILATKRNLAMVYQMTADQEKAISLLQNILEAELQRNVPIAVARTNMLLGMSYQDVGIFDKAHHVLEQAISLYQELNMAPELGLCYGHLAITYDGLKAKSQALFYYSKAMDLLRDTQSDYGLAKILTERARMFMRQNVYEQARQDLAEALQHAKKENALHFQRDIYRLQASVDSAQNNMKSAFINLQNYHAYNDSLGWKNQQLQLARLKTQLDYAELQKQQVEKALEVEQLELGYKEKLLRWSSAVYLLSFMLFVSFIFLTRQRYKNKLKWLQQDEELKRQTQEKQQYKAELTQKNAYIERLAINIIEKDELLGRLQNEVKKLGKTGAIDRQSGNLLDELIRNSMDLNAKREEFEQYVNQVYQGFFHRLDQRFPGLSSNEKRLCALLKLNLSSKQIASLMNIAPTSVDMNRYRMRKKLQLDTDQRLSEVLADIDQ